MKRKILKIVAVILVVLGVVLVAIPPVSNNIGIHIAHSIVNDFKKNKSMIIDKEKPTEGSDDTDTDDNNKTDRNEYSNKTVIYKLDLDRLYKDSVAYNEVLKTKQYDLLYDENYRQPALNLSDYGIPDGVYGYVAAPSIGMELPIYLGASDYNMSYGAAHMTYTSLPIGGKSTNCVLSGHTGYIGRIFFDYIKNLDIDDEVFVENYWSKLTYKVINKKILKKYQSSDCYISDGKDMLTMLTCISDGHGGFDRYYVICERK